MESNEEPDKFFIVPYRDREQHLELFLNQMHFVLKGEKYLILVIHQCDKRHFNRGAMKNIGFKIVKNRYPKTYKEKTLIFHDVDHVIWKGGILDFSTKKGVIKHHYGFPPQVVQSLGGIFTINAGDFEKTNGFPNFWAWGYEDNQIYYRARKQKLKFDYSNFKGLKHPDIILFWHGQHKLTNENYVMKYFKNDNGWGINEITNLKSKAEVYQDRQNVLLLNITKFDVPGDYPKLEKKFIQESFDSRIKKKAYDNVFKRLY